MDSNTQGSAITMPILKLFIGFVAGLCAALFPRLTAALATQGSNLIFFPLSYVVLALVFAMLIGVVVMILGWRVPAKPSDTFMMALGIPALLTGALNATLDTNMLQNLAQQKDRLTRS
jgi:MFS family permease